jgi:hypothetical protein
MVMNPDSAHLEGENRNPPEMAGVFGLGIHPMIQCSQESFRRALPELLKSPRLRRWWVAFHGEERIGVAATEDDLYQECDRRGLKEHEYVVRCIVPEIPQSIDATPPFDV